MRIQMGCGHAEEVSEELALSEEQIHYLEHLGFCFNCSRTELDNERNYQAE